MKFFGRTLSALEGFIELKWAVSTLVAALGLLMVIKASANAPSSDQTSKDSQIVKIDGSSTVFPIIEGAAEEFQKESKGLHKVTVGISGTGGGFKKFCRGETDVQNASRPILDKEIEECRKTNVGYFEFPIAYDALVIAVNAKNTWLNSISIEELNKMWAPEAQGKVSRWKQVNPAWPDEEFKLFGAGSDSGTFDYFTEAVNGKPRSSRGDYTASEDDNALVTGIERDKNALGFIPMSYYMRRVSKGKIKALGIVASGGKEKGKIIQPSKVSVKDGSYVPFSRPLFIYVSSGSLKKDSVKAFLNYTLKNGAALSKDADYVELPDDLYKMNQENLKKDKIGTVFAGHSEFGLKIEDLMKKERKL